MTIQAVAEMQCPVLCVKRNFHSYKTSFLHTKGFAIPAVFFLYLNWTPSFLLLTSVEESVDLEGMTRYDAAPIWLFQEKGISEGSSSPATFQHVSFHCDDHS